MLTSKSQTVKTVCLIVDKQDHEKSVTVSVETPLPKAFSSKAELQQRVASFAEELAKEYGITTVRQPDGG